ncbi:hypothetical protein [Thalassotalea piscium]|uniref:Lipoprotein n=1 Tax=Thalassotalea piscium TaxID=1230533 RepID=A0A7X0TS39_9GAMM|nr:hypothetical protein [Thalassotalea piscium]MBB6541665.1 hypothetical protein [Thalassotalea piscium]
MKAILIIVASVLLFGCTSNQLKIFAAEAISGSAIGYSKERCGAIKVACPLERYDEWKTSNGKFGCSCAR